MAGPLNAFIVKNSFKTQIDKILNLHFFRKLAGKTQVILSLAGPAVRTRLTHTVEVSRIAKKLCVDFDLNVDLAEAIALAHDIGHTPFGHVGERALKEITCGCDTLKGKINDTDFDNSGFKHNLQSLRVLTTLETISDDDNEWPYVLWGVSAHSKMSWSKPYSGMQNEILISCKHCDWVYSCFYENKGECKRNILEKKKKPQGICRPSFCATLETYKTRNEVPEEKVLPGESKEDFIGRFKDDTEVWCKKRCYLSKLSEHKIKNIEMFDILPYFFDHPFPNSFYASDYMDYFFKNGNKDFISVEALIVNQADEIAQRQQDLEDAISAKLISFEMGKSDVEKLTGNPTNASNQKDLGETIIDFYTRNLIETTKKNFEDFSRIANLKINIYCFMDILYLLERHCKQKRKEWIEAQIDELIREERIEPIVGLDEAFQFDYKESYFYLIVYDFLDTNLRFGDYESCRETLKKLSELFKKRKLPIIDISDLGDAKLYKKLDFLRNTLRESFRDDYAFFIEPDKDDENNYWQNLTGLNLYSFHVLHQIYQSMSEKIKKQGRDCDFKIDDLRDINIESAEKSYNSKNTFDTWKNILRTDANRVLAKLVVFTNDRDKQTRFENFEDKQRDYILKSELVEKNDGKANYILRRLFGAYMTNSHQLPDNGLDYILLALTNEITMTRFIKYEQETCMNILDKLRKTTITGYDEVERLMNNNLMELPIDNFEKIQSSNEIKALCKKRKHLYEFYQCFYEEIKGNLVKWIGSEDYNDRYNLELTRLKFRGILDNPILNAMPYWKSLLTRGTCDYIASRSEERRVGKECRSRWSPYH